MRSPAAIVRDFAWKTYTPRNWPRPVFDTRAVFGSQPEQITLGIRRLNREVFAGGDTQFGAAAPEPDHITSIIVAGVSTLRAS